MTRSSRPGPARLRRETLALAARDTPPVLEPAGAPGDELHRAVATISFAEADEADPATPDIL